MSWDETKKAVNSDLKVPLNHLIWLNDYKTYGENSYVFQDKRILKELYASPIAANDAKIYEEAKTYNRASMTIDDLAKWFGFRYEFLDRNNYELKLLAKGFSSWTDEDLSSALEMHYNGEINIANCAFVGEKRSVTLSAMDAVYVGESHVEQIVEFAIADLDHDTLVTPINSHKKAAITLTQVNSLKNGSTIEAGYLDNVEAGRASNAKGWSDCSRRKWCNEVYYNALPLGFRNVVKEVNKSTSAGNNSSVIKTTYDKVFLASEIEIFGITPYSFAGEGSKYQHSINKKGDPGWALRSPYKNSASNVYVRADGKAGEIFVGSSYTTGIAPFLCV